MAIMWDPPGERPSLEPTPAELAWKQWLMEALIAQPDNVAPPETRDREEVKPAA